MNIEFGYDLILNDLNHMGIQEVELRVKSRMVISRVWNDDVGEMLGKKKKKNQIL